MYSVRPGRRASTLEPAGADDAAVRPRRPPLRQAFRALHNRNYRLFWIGQVISVSGTWMQRIGMAWLVLRLTNSPLALGIVTACQTLPVLLFSLFGGVIADRVPKRRLLVVTQSIMAVQALVLAALVYAGHTNLAAIYVLAAILGSASAIDTPTRQAFVKEMVGPADVANAVALNSIVVNSARLIGPSLGGITIALVGVSGCFGLNAVSFLAVIAALLLMRPAELYERVVPSRGAVLSQIRTGLSYSVRTPPVALVMLLMAVIGTFGYNFTVILPLIAQYVLHSSAAGFGTLTSAMGVGSLIAAFGIAYSGKVSQRTLLIGATGFSLLLLVVAWSDRWLTTIPLLVVLGLFSIVFSTTANSRLQLLTPPELRGRVMSLYTLLFMGSTPIGSVVVGWLASHQGVRLALGELAVLCLLGTVAGFVYLRLHAARPAVQAELQPR